MSYKSLGRFGCDGCKVIESDAIELEADVIQPQPPVSWLRVETVQNKGELHVHQLTHYCPACAPLILSYLRGRVATDGGMA